MSHAVTDREACLFLTHGFHGNAEHGLLLLDRYVHDMPCSLDTAIENISDQSHVPWAHHGVAGDRCVGHLNEAAIQYKS